MVVSNKHKSEDGIQEKEAHKEFPTDGGMIWYHEETKQTAKNYFFNNFHYMNLIYF